MSLQKCLEEFGYTNFKEEEITKDFISTVTKYFSDLMIDKMGLANSRDAVFTEKCKNYLKELSTISSNFKELLSSCNSLYKKANHYTDEKQIDIINESIIYMENELICTNNAINFYKELKIICEFVDTYQHITSLNIDCCHEAIRIKSYLDHSVSCEFKEKKEYEKISELVNMVIESIKNHLIAFFSNAIFFNENTMELSVCLTESEWIKMYSYASKLQIVDVILDNTFNAFYEFGCHLFTEKRNLKVISRKKVQVLVFDDYNDDCNKDTKNLLMNLKIYFNFINDSFSKLHASKALLNEINANDNNDQSAYEFINNLSRKLYERIYLEKLSTLVARNDQSVNIEWINLQHYIKSLKFFNTIEETSLLLLSECTINEKSIVNGDDSMHSFSSIEDNDFINKLDRIRHLFTKNDWILSVSSINKDSLIKSPLFNNDSLLKNHSQNHPKYLVNLLNQPIILSDYNTTLQIHSFVVEFMKILSNYVFEDILRNNISVDNFKFIINAYKIFTLITDSMLKEVKTNSFALIFNDLQVFNYFTLNMNAILISEAGNSYPYNLMLVYYMIKVDYIFNRKISKIFDSYCNELILCVDDIDLLNHTKNVGKHAVNVTKNLKNLFLKFVENHDIVLPRTILKRYICSLINKVLDVIISKVYSFTDIIEKDIKIIETSLKDIMNCLPIDKYVDKDEKLTLVPSLIRLQLIVTILNSSLHEIAHLWSSTLINKTTNYQNIILKDYFTKDEVIKLINSIFQDSNFKTDVINKIRNE